jgi:hypothetical protein
VSGKHEQIFQVKAASSKKGGVVVEEKREARRGTADLSDYDFRGRIVAEQ